MTTQRPLLLPLALAAGLLLRAGPASAQPTQAPNIVVIVSDDLGWPYYHFMIQKLRDELDGFGPSDDGSNTGEDALHREPCPAKAYDDPNPYGFPTSTCAVCDPTSSLHAGSGQTDLDVCTPSLDRLARGGVVFDRGYATGAQCEHARQSLYTGLNHRDFPEIARKWGCKNRGWETFPEALNRSDQGGPAYTTYFAGKLHLGMPPTNLFCAPESTGDETTGEESGLQRIKRFLKNRYDGTAAPTAPWLVVWAAKAPHYSYGFPDQFDALYQKTAWTTPPYIVSTSIQVDKIPEYLRSITYLDARIGELDQFLWDLEYAQDDPNPEYDPYILPTPPTCPGTSGYGTATTCRFQAPGPRADKSNYQGFRSNTLIIYLADHGSGIQDSKGHFSENGLRTPIVANYASFDVDGSPAATTAPGHIPGLAPTSTAYANFNDALVGAIDIFPTLLEYGQRTVPRDFPDSKSFKAVAEGTVAPLAWRSRFMQNWKVDGDIAVIDGTTGFKLYVNTPPVSAVVQAKKLFRIDEAGGATPVPDPFERTEIGGLSTMCLPSTHPQSEICATLQGVADCWHDKGVGHAPGTCAPTSWLNCENNADPNSPCNQCEGRGAPAPCPSPAP